MANYKNITLSLMPFLVGVLAVVLLVPDVRGFPYLGFSIITLVILFLTFFTRPQRTKLLTTYFVISIVFAIFLFIKSNPLLTMLNTISVLFIYGFMMFEKKSKDRFSIFSYGLSFLLVFIQFLVYLFNKTIALKTEGFNTSNLSGKRSSKSISYNKKLFTQTMLSILIVIVVLPILSSTNVFFAKFLENVYSLFNLTNLIRFLFGDTFVEFVLRFTVFVFFTVVSWFVLYYKDRVKTVIKEQHIFDSSYFIVPRVVMAVILLIYFITELQLYFATGDTLQAMGYSNSMHAREIFAQLAVVSVIIFALIYSQGKSLRHHKLVTSVLVIEALFLNTIALNSVLSYIDNWGFTQKRLYGITFVTWVYGIFLVFIVPFITARIKLSIARVITFWTLFVVLVINFANFDYLIYHHSPTTEKGVDHYYLATQLTFDSRSYKTHLDQLQKDYIKPCVVGYNISAESNYFYNKSQGFIEGFDSILRSYSVLVNKLKSVKEEYNTGFSFNQFNYYRSLGYLDAINTTLDKYEKDLKSCSDNYKRASASL